MRQRNENEHGLAQNLVALVFRHEFDGAAIVQTVSELDQYHADIIIESQENTFEILRLEALRVAGIIVLLVLIVEHVLDFRQTVDERRDLVPEQMLDIIHGVIRVFHHVVQQCRRYGLVTQSDIIDHNLGDGDRVQDIRFS